MMASRDRPGELHVLDLFSGIGGFTLGLERAGMRTVAFCEADERARRVLRDHWRTIPVYRDVRLINFDDFGASGSSPVDVIAGGFPCQDTSLAGSGSGLAGEHSGLWREFLRAVRMVRPRFAVVENVAALLVRGMGQLLGDLAAIGYDAEWHCIRACDLGAIHERDRVFIVAYPSGARRQGLVTSADIGTAGPWRLRGAADLFAIADAAFQRGDRWPQPLLRGMDDGLSGRVDRVFVIGNAIVPQIAEIIGRAIMREHRRPWWWR